MTGPETSDEMQNRASACVSAAAACTDSGIGYSGVAAIRYRRMCHSPASNHDSLASTPAARIHRRRLSADNFRQNGRGAGAGAGGTERLTPTFVAGGDGCATGEAVDITASSAVRPSEITTG